MKKLILLLITAIAFNFASSQTTLEEAVDFNVKTIYGEPIQLFPILDNENKIVVVDFFSTTCGPCQDYAPDFQACYEKFGYNEGNVYFIGINWGNDNQGVKEFDSIFGLTFPSASGSQGGGNIVYGDYDILSYPTIILITPDHNIVEQYITPPDEETITNAIIAAGGLMVNTPDILIEKNDINIFPNPVVSKGDVEFSISTSSVVQLKMINLMGQEVYKSSPEYKIKGEVKLSFPTYDLQSGFYIVEIVANNETIGTARISVSH